MTTLIWFIGVIINMIIYIFNTSWTSFPFLSVLIGWQKKGLSTFQAIVAVPLLPLAGGEGFFLLAEDDETFPHWTVMVESFLFLLAGGGEAGSHWLAWCDTPCLQNCIVTCRVETNTNFVNAKGYSRDYYRLRILRLFLAYWEQGRGERETERGIHAGRVRGEPEWEKEEGFLTL